MNDTEKFLFDLQGFLKVPSFLTPAEVDALNAAFDANEDKRGEDGNHNTGGSDVLEGPAARASSRGCSNGKNLTACPSAPSWRTKSSSPISTRSLAAAGRWTTRPLCSAAARALRA